MVIRGKKPIKRTMSVNSLSIQLDAQPEILHQYYLCIGENRPTVLIS